MTQRSTPKKPINLKTKRLTQFKINHNILILLVTLFLVATANLGFFTKVLEIYPLTSNPTFILSLVGLLLGLLWLMLQIVSYRPTVKIVLILMLIVSAICSYFTDAYGTIFDTNMLINGLETDHAEARDLLALGFIIRFVLLGIIPSIFIAKVKLKPITFKQGIIQKFITLLTSLALMVLCLLPFGDQYASFFRQHKPVRYYTIPVTPIYSAFKLGRNLIEDWCRPNTLIKHASDAKRIATDSRSKPKLMVFVVGEAVRADHIGLNGYERNTTPLLAKQSDVYSLKEVTSCGTSTAYSVPCMFSYMEQNNYDMKMAKYHENVLDTLNKLGVNVIWRDNNSSSKGVANRVTYQEFKTADNNPICDEECRDIGMLDGFDSLLHSSPNTADGRDALESANQPLKPQDTLVLLHQMGNHGPAYYKRYPKAFEEYTPVCNSNELSKCDKQAVINGFDNTIRYTDYFLNAVINTLKSYQDKYDVVMLYVSDHGESLGENNVYLHGLPYSIAPRAQKHVPVIIWSPSSNHIDPDSITNLINKPVSHDYITPTLLNYFGITTQETKDKPTFFTTKIK